MKFHNFINDLVRKKFVESYFLEYNKFMLPDGGYSSYTGVYSALEGEKLNLPFEECIFEWVSKKSINICCLAHHAKVNDQEVIGLKLFRKNKDQQDWYNYPELFIVRDPWCVEKIGKRYAVNIKWIPNTWDTNHPNFEIIQSSIFSPILDTLNVLACSNISLERTPRRVHPYTALPMDDYWLLKVEQRTNTYEDKGGTHRSPREHVRRGHPHRYHTKNGTVKHWINSIVVNAGVGGVISKDYVIKPTSEKIFNNDLTVKH